MAVIGNTFPTLVDQAKRTDPNGSTSQIVEVLGKYLPILNDMAWTEGNLPTGHRYTARTGLPSVGAGITWRRLNQGVDPGKSTTDQYDETCGMLEGYSKVDVDLAALNGNEAAFRLSEDKAFLQAFNIEVARSIFYESAATNPERMTGLSPRLNFVSGNNDPSANQIILAEPYATVTDLKCSSIWLIAWSPETVFGIFPKGSKAGLSNEDLGKQLTLETASSTKQFLAYVTRWQWKLGLCVRDYRYVVRIANVDTVRIGTLTYASGTFSAAPDLAMLMLEAISRLFSQEGVRPVFYMNRAVFNALNKQLVARQANWLEWVDAGGRRLPAFYGVPIVFVDALISTEAKIQ